LVALFAWEKKMNKADFRKGLFALLCALAVGAPALAQDFDKVEIKTDKLADGIYMLTGAGGNIGLGVGDDAVYMIDDQYAPLTPKILAAVAKLTDKPVKFVINTHFHGDHSGGNENLGKTGSVIVAQDNVRKRMSVDSYIAAFDMKSPASPKIALPVVTFTESVSLHLNGEDIQVFYVPSAHTDGDSMVWFKNANILHMGDTFFNGFYPFIDLDSGGSLQGMVAAADRALKMVNDQTKIIPGHGPLGDKAALKAYRDMLVTVADRTKKAVAAHKTREQFLAGNPGAGLDDTWGKGFLKPQIFYTIAYKSYMKKDQADAKK
jgi:cyclase